MQSGSVEPPQPAPTLGTFSAGGIPPAILGGTSAVLTILPTLEPSSDIMGGPNLLIATGTFMAGTMAGYAAHNLSMAGLPDASNEFLYQDQMAGWSLLTPSLVAGWAARPSIPIAATAGWGLLATEIVTQRQVRVHWGMDSSRLAFLARLQIGGIIASGYALDDYSLARDAKPTNAALALFALWPTTYAMAAIAHHDNADHAGRRGASSIALLALATPAVAWSASSIANGSPDATLLAIAGTSTTSMLASPFLPPLPGSTQSHRFALLGACIGVHIGFANEWEALKKEELSSDAPPDYRKSRTEMWKTATIGSVTGAAAGWVFGHLLSRRHELAFEPSLPTPVVGMDGRLSMGLGGVIVHIR